MTALDLYDPDDFSPIDLVDDDFENEDADEWLGSLAGAIEGAYSKYGKKRLKSGLEKTSWGRKKYGGKSVGEWASHAGQGLLSGLRVFANSASLEADPLEPEYEADAIDAMEALMEDALDGEDGIDAKLASDEMVARSFGTMRSAPGVRGIMAMLSQDVRRMVLAARRNPRLRNVARLAPLAMRRTASMLMRMVAARRRVTPQLARSIFRSVIGRLMRSSRLRSAALKRARIGARRGRSGMRRAPSGYPGHPRPRPYHARMRGYGY